MGSLEALLPLRKDSLNRSLSSSSSHSSSRISVSQRLRSRFARLLRSKKLEFILWSGFVALFLSILVLFQASLPNFVAEKSKVLSSDIDVDLVGLKEIGVLDFGEDVRFGTFKLPEKFRREVKELNSSSDFVRKRQRYALRKPHLALIFSDLLVDPQQILMVTVAASLRGIGYSIEVYSLADGPVHSVWRNLGYPVTILQIDAKKLTNIDWLKFVQEPFKSLPIIWTINDRTLATWLRRHNLTGEIDLVNDWKRIFNRANVVVFPNFVLPMIYSTFDAGNYYVIPGSPAEAWEADRFFKENLRSQMGFVADDFVIAIVGSQYLYRGLWLEHALVLQALRPVFEDFSGDEDSKSHFKIVILSGDSSSNYSTVIETLAIKLRYPKGVVENIQIDEQSERILIAVDVVIYGSFLEEQLFPQNLLKSMCFGKPIIAPDLNMIKKYVDDGVNGYLFPKNNMKVLTQILRQVISNGRVSPSAHNIASIGKSAARNLMVSNVVEGYALLLENVLRLPSEVAFPKAVTEIPLKLKEEWQWQVFEAVPPNKTLGGYQFLDKDWEQWNRIKLGGSGAVEAAEEAFIYSIWEEEKLVEIANAKKRREDEELKDRTDQAHGTWEDVYRNAKRADRSRNDLHERDDGELERTGQPLCIYEPFYGEGTWPFLHRKALYRGIGLSTKGRRPGADDIDAPSRLPLLSNPYYRDALGEYGAFFAIANRIDRLHKNAWIGFQSWRATARKVSLSDRAEKALLETIESRKFGDTLYFWARMDTDPRNALQQDFWSFCDSINAGNCKFAFSEALKKMYGVKHEWDSIPPMPADGDTWSVMHSWVLPTRSFVEFVMFSRMFVDALDTQIYDEHHRSGQCYLSLSKDKHCYSRVLELLINVWAYHSARRMVYVDPDTGAMQEQHRFNNRKGQMWVKWFSYTTLKSMDEDLAEEADSDHPSRRWLWPSTGEVFWQGVYERERNLRHKEKEKRKRQSRDKILRIKRRTRQKVIGKYVKPPPEEMVNNSTMA
ncbi:Glycosyl transferase, family 1, partial [Dillenia turbinata]